LQQISDKFLTDDNTTLLSNFVSNRHLPQSVLSNVFAKTKTALDRSEHITDPSYKNTVDALTNNMMKLLGDPQATPDMMEYAANSNNLSFQAAAASNRALSSPELLTKLYNSKSKEVRYNAASNPNLPITLVDANDDNMRQVLLMRNDTTPEQLKQIADKTGSTRWAQSIISTILGRKNIQPDVVAHIATTHPDEDSRQMAAIHHRLPEETRNAIVHGPLSSNMLSALRNAPLSPEQHKHLYGVAMNQAFVHKHESKDQLDPDHRFHVAASYFLLMPSEDQQRELASLPEEALEAFGEKTSLASRLETPEQLALYNRLYANLEPDSPLPLPHVLMKLSDSKEFANYAANNKHPAIQRKVLRSSDLSPEAVNMIVNNTGNFGVLRNAAEAVQGDYPHGIFEKTAPNILNKLSNYDPATNPADHNHVRDALNALAGIPARRAVSPDILKKIYFHPMITGEAKAAILERTHLPEEITNAGLEDANKDIRQAAAAATATTNPDRFNRTLDGKTVEIAPIVERLKHLKGLITDMGGKIHKRDLKQMQYTDIPGQILDKQGFVTPDAIDNFIKEAPKAKYNVSYGEWDDSQRHDETKKQRVFQINMTNDHIKQLKEQGLYDTFAEMHQLSFSSGHPVQKHTIGWVRVDDSQKDHHHYDEVQSDLGQNAMHRIYNLRNDPKVDSKKADAMVNNMKSIAKIFAGPFKNIDQMLLHAAHQISRDEGIGSTSMDLLDDQCNQSGLVAGKEVPGHFKFTYEQMPKTLGYSQKGKKDVIPKAVSEESHVQYRKLIKSLDIIKTLLQGIEKNGNK
jgi:hypothetical protein